MLHQRWIKTFGGVTQWMDADCGFSPTEIYCLVFTSGSLICQFMSLFQQPEQYSILLCWVWCSHAADSQVQSPQRRDFSLTQRPFAVTLSGITEEEFPTELPSDRSTIQRPPTEWEEVAYCVLPSECLAGRGLSVWQWPVFPTLQQNWEEKPRADFWGCIHWWECVLGCCWTEVDCSLHPLVGNPCIAVASKQELWTPKGQLISLVIAFTLTTYIGVDTYHFTIFSLTK